MTTQVWLAAGAGVLFMLLFFGVALVLTFSARRDVPPEAMFFFRVVMALTAGAFGALLPGALDVSVDAPGVMIRAGGSLALALLVYRLNPPTLSAGMVSKAGAGARVVQSRGDNTDINVR